jgi:uncharacterized DUF497 family protein
MIFAKTKVWYNMKISFEYDLNKSLSNLQKHGIDFEKAKELFRGNVAVAEAHSVEDEIRFMAVGKIDKKFYTVIYTYRKGAVRIISARRSRKDEEKLYETYYSKRV